MSWGDGERPAPAGLGPGLKPSLVTLPVPSGVTIALYAPALSPEVWEGDVFISRILSCPVRFQEVLFQKDVEVARLHRVKLSLILHLLLDFSWSLFITGYLEFHSIYQRVIGSWWQSWLGRDHRCLTCILPSHACHSLRGNVGALKTVGSVGAGCESQLCSGSSLPCATAWDAEPSCAPILKEKQAAKTRLSGWLREWHEMVLGPR